MKPAAIRMLRPMKKGNGSSAVLCFCWFCRSLEVEEDHQDT
jgi:hypothetical protein